MARRASSLNTVSDVKNHSIDLPMAKKHFLFEHKDLPILPHAEFIKRQLTFFLYRRHELKHYNSIVIRAFD